MIRIQLRIVKENTNLMIGIEILASKNVKTFSPINSVCPYITNTDPKKRFICNIFSYS